MVDFSRRHSRYRHGFTVIELLVVIAVIIVLVGLLLTGLRAVSGAGRDAITKSRFQAISQALSAFRNDHGYFPPILRGGLTPQRQGPAYNDLVPSPLFDPSNSSYAVQMQGWYSVTTLPEFLLGICGRNVDGYGQVAGDSNSDTELPALGIRSPGADGVWGSSLYYSGPGLPGSALAEDRQRSIYSPGTLRFRRPGPVYGPYLGIDQRDFLGKIQSTDQTWSVNDQEPEPLRLLNENDQSWTLDPCDLSLTDQQKPAFVLLDGFGKPIEYFRTPYAVGDLARNSDKDYDNIPGNGLQRSTLAHVIRLRPFTFTAVDVEFSTEEDGDGSGAYTSSFVTDLGPEAANPPDGSTSLELKSAQWAIFSGGVDQTYNPWVRSAAVNEDNLVEIGR